MNQVAPQPVIVGIAHGRKTAKLPVLPVISGQQGKRDAVLSGGDSDFINAVAPVGGTAKQADNDHARRHDDGVDVRVHRQVVSELEDVGEAHRGKTWRTAGRGRRQHGKFRVGSGKNDDVTGGLTDIERLRAIRDNARLRGQQMHQVVRPPTSLAMACRSMPLRPITTSSLRFSSSGSQGRS